MNGSPSAEQIEWARRFTKLDIAAGAAAKGLAPGAQGRMPAGAQAATPAVQGPPTNPARPGPDASHGSATNGAGTAEFEAELRRIARAGVGWDTRVNKITSTYENQPLLKEFDRAKKAFIDAGKAGFAKKDLSGMAGVMDAMEAAVRALEADAAKLPARQGAAAAAGDKVARMSDAAIANMTAESKAALVKDMLGAGKPTGKLRAAQVRLYRDTPIDAGYRRDDEARQAKVAATLANDRELAAARGNWGKLDKEGLRKVLGRVIAAQSKEYGIPAPQIVFFPNEEKGVPVKAGQVVDAYFDWEDGKMHVNLAQNSGIRDFMTAINTVLHENAHHYQAELAKMVEAGTLKPDDPRYKQALMFEVNQLEPGGYIDPDETPNHAQAIKDYVSQPLERSAYETGDKTTARMAGAIVPPKNARPHVR